MFLTILFNARIHFQDLEDALADDSPVRERLERDIVRIMRQFAHYFVVKSVCDMFDPRVLDSYCYTGRCQINVINLTGDEEKSKKYSWMDTKFYQLFDKCTCGINWDICE